MPFYSIQFCAFFPCPGIMHPTVPPPAPSHPQLRPPSCSSHDNASCLSLSPLFPPVGLQHTLLWTLRLTQRPDTLSCERCVWRRGLTHCPVNAAWPHWLRGHSGISLSISLMSAVFIMPVLVSRRNPLYLFFKAIYLFIHLPNHFFI